MRLYLSSFRVGRCGEHLTGLTRGGMRAAVIANAIDHTPTGVRTAGVRRELEDLGALGFQVEEVDLREVPRGGPLLDLLGGFDLVWLRGGNVFLLRAALATSGADLALLTLMERDAIVYGGYSARRRGVPPTRCTAPDPPRRRGAPGRRRGRAALR